MLVVLLVVSSDSSSSVSVSSSCSGSSACCCTTSILSSAWKEKLKYMACLGIYICLLAFVPMLGIYVVVGHRADVSCRFWKPPRAGEVLPKFSIKSNLFCIPRLLDAISKFQNCFPGLLTHAISAPLCSFRPRVPINPLVRHRVILLFLHHRLIG